MKIDLIKISVRDLAEGYEDNFEEGVIGYGGKLDIRPPFQREFVKKEMLSLTPFQKSFL